MIYRRDGIIFMNIQDVSWGLVKIAKILPSETNWGRYGDFAEEELGLIPVISSDVLDRALRGDCTPFMNSGVRDPRGCLRVISIDRECEDKDGCLSYKQGACFLGSKKMPDCFSPRSKSNYRPLILAWFEGYYLIREEVI